MSCAAAGRSVAHTLLENALWEYGRIQVPAGKTKTLESSRRETRSM